MAYIHIDIVATKGSTPRNKGASMVVERRHIDKYSIEGTIGGGVLEFDALEHAKYMLENEIDTDEKRYTLGPESGQCCGGEVQLRFQHLATPPIGRAPLSLAVFGAGHVGAALALMARSVGVKTRLIDARPKIPAGRIAEYECLAIPEAAIQELVDNTAIVVATHDHGLDFEIVKAALRRPFPYIGMIGSKTKAARLRRDCEAETLDAARVVVPIGKASGAQKSKRPEVIAASTLADILSL